MEKEKHGRSLRLRDVALIRQRRMQLEVMVKVVVDMEINPRYVEVSFRCCYVLRLSTSSNAIVRVDLLRDDDHQNPLFLHRLSARF